MAQSAGAAEYTDYISAKGYDFPDECPVKNTKQSYGKGPVMPEIWGMWITPLVPLFEVPLEPRVVAPYRVQSMGQKEQESVLMLNRIV